MYIYYMPIVCWFFYSQTRIKIPSKKERTRMKFWCDHIKRLYTQFLFLFFSILLVLCVWLIFISSQFSANQIPLYAYVIFQWNETRTRARITKQKSANKNRQHNKFVPRICVWAVNSLLCICMIEPVKFGSILCAIKFGINHSPSKKF